MGSSLSRRFHWYPTTYSYYIHHKFLISCCGGNLKTPALGFSTVFLGSAWRLIVNYFQANWTGPGPNKKTMAILGATRGGPKAFRQVHLREEQCERRVVWWRWPRWGSVLCGGQRGGWGQHGRRGTDHENATTSQSHSQRSRCNHGFLHKQGKCLPKLAVISGFFGRFLYFFPTLINSKCFAKILGPLEAVAPRVRCPKTP